MNEAKYLKIITELSRLTGYATGVLKGCFWQTDLESIENTVQDAIAYMNEQQDLIMKEIENA